MSAAYQLLPYSSVVFGAAAVLRASDGARIAADPLDADWTDYLTWLSAPNVPDAVPGEGATQITPAQYFARFTHFELGTISAVALSDAATLTWLTQTAAATLIDLLAPETRAGLVALVTFGALDVSRPDVILTP